MEAAAALNDLRAHASELRAAGLVHLHVFGSVARGEATVGSEVDLLAEFDQTSRVTLVTVAGMECRLSDLLGAKVDLSSLAWMREPIRGSALREALLAF